jgi:hypothetical protein
VKLALPLSLLFGACTGAVKTPAAAPTSSPTPTEDAPAVQSEAPVGSEAPAPAAPKAIPWSCDSKDGDVCVPDPQFAARLCNGAFPDVALTLLSKDAPFTRMYLTGDVDGWNADGGMSARARLRFDEEVLILKRRAPPKNGIVVGTGGGYLVMRWDGNCYTLDDGEVTTRKPPAPRHASIPWRHLSERTKDALLQSAKVLAAYQRRGKECGGATSGEVTKACETADAALSAAVVAEVRGGVSVPTPERIP